MRAQLTVLGILLSLPAAAADKPMPCGVSTKPGTTCSCDVRTLRPLQGAIGMEEVRAKQQKIAEHPKKEWKDLEEDPIKVVRGRIMHCTSPDHHHGADAWRLAGQPHRSLPDRQAPGFQYGRGILVGVDPGSPGEIERRRRETGEACKIFDEGKAYRASDIDVMWLNGFGFPRYRGGLMYWADGIGVAEVYRQIQQWHQQYGERWAPAPLLRRLAETGTPLRETKPGRPM